MSGRPADLVHAGDSVMVARGGRGGLGNTHFATSTQRAPRIAQKGEPGEERSLDLELKTIAHAALIDRRACLLDDRSRIRLLASGRHDLGGRIGDLVSLFPFGGGADGLTTGGLPYPLANEPLRSGSTRGLSNVRTAPDASLSVGTGLVLVVEIAATL